MTAKPRYDNYIWNGLRIAYVMDDGGLYWKKDIYTLVSPKNHDDHDSEDHSYGQFDNEALAWQLAKDVWGDDKALKLEVRAASVIVAKTDGLPADAVYSEEAR